jgi:Glyoxalase-like domain
MKTLWMALAAIACGPLMAAAGAQPRGVAVLDRIDHFVYATPDLDAGIARVEKLLGVKATPGGQHPGRGTRNALIAVGPGGYIEIIGPDPQQGKPDQPRPFGLDGLSEPRLVTWAAKETDLPRLVRQAAERGVTLGELSSGSRKRPDGLLLTWQYTNPRVVVADGIVPFFIDWGKTPHPAESAVSGGRITRFSAEHPDPDKVKAILDHLGLDLPVTLGPVPRLIATISTPRGSVELR